MSGVGVVQKHTGMDIVQQLEPFIVAGARLTGREIGVGSYASVVEAEIQGTVCVAKRTHETLIDHSLYGSDRIIRMFADECRLMSILRHPNIVQFLGVAVMPGSRLPALLMEKLDTDLHIFIEENHNIPLSIKRSILVDVAKGVSYLHCHSPPVIHRDLSARNVLLSSAMVAKITDLGSCRIFDFHRRQLMTMTKAPGNMYYMPPEAQEEQPQYNTSLDIFSFGHLMIFTLTQVFPEVNAPTFLDETSQRIFGRTELERRSSSFRSLCQVFGDQHPLVQLAASCLHNKPDNRPSIETVLQRLERCVLLPYRSWGANKLDMVVDTISREMEIEALQQHVNTQQGEMDDALAEVHSLQEAKQTQYEVIETHCVQIENDCARIRSLQKEITSRTEENAKLRRQLRTPVVNKKDGESHRMLTEKYEMEIQSLKYEHQRLIAEKQEEIGILREQTQVQQQQFASQMQSLEADRLAQEERIESMQSHIEKDQMKFLSLQEELEAQKKQLDLARTQLQKTLSEKVRMQHPQSSAVARNPTRSKSSSCRHNLATMMADCSIKVHKSEGYVITLYTPRAIGYIGEPWKAVLAISRRSVLTQVLQDYLEHVLPHAYRIVKSINVRDLTGETVVLHIPHPEAEQQGYTITMEDSEIQKWVVDSPGRDFQSYPPRFECTVLPHGAPESPLDVNLTVESNTFNLKTPAITPQYTSVPSDSTDGDTPTGLSPEQQQYRGLSPEQRIYHGLTQEQQSQLSDVLQREPSENAFLEYVGSKCFLRWNEFAIALKLPDHERDNIRMTCQSFTRGVNLMAEVFRCWKALYTRHTWMQILLVLLTDTVGERKLALDKIRWSLLDTDSSIHR